MSIDQNFARGLNNSGNKAHLPKATLTSTVKDDVKRAPAAVGNGSVLAASGLMSLTLPKLQNVFPSMGSNAGSVLRNMASTRPKFPHAIGNAAMGGVSKLLSAVTLNAVKLPNRV